MVFTPEILVLGWFIGIMYLGNSVSTPEPSMEPTMEPTLASKMTDDSDILTLSLFIFVIAWVAVILIIFVLAILYQHNAFNSCCDIMADNTYKFSIIIVGIQLLDTVSDAYLCTQIKHEYDDTQMNIYFALFTASIVFLIVPYLGNIFISIGVSKISAIKTNRKALEYFVKNGIKYICLTIITGGSIPILYLLSSNIFGFDSLTSGLTQHDLKLLQKYKIYTTVITQNIPQLIIQALYTLFLGKVDPIAVCAFVGSVLSIIATLYQVYISSDCCFTGEYTYYQLYLRNTKTDYILSHDYKFKIKKHRWRRFSLSKELSQSLNINPKRLEIGYISPTLNGIFIDIVHGISDDDITKIERRKFNNKAVNSVNSLLKSLYTFNAADIIQTICRHFEFEYSKDFSIEFISHDMNNDSNTNTDNNDTGGDTEITNLILQTRDDNDPGSNKENNNINNINDDSSSDTSNDDMIKTQKK